MLFQDPSCRVYRTVRLHDGSGWLWFPLVRSLLKDTQWQALPPWLARDTGHTERRGPVTLAGSCYLRGEQEEGKEALGAIEGHT